MLICIIKLNLFTKFINFLWHQKGFWGIEALIFLLYNYKLEREVYS